MVIITLSVNLLDDPWRYAKKKNLPRKCVESCSSLLNISKKSSWNPNCWNGKGMQACPRRGLHEIVVIIYLTKGIEHWVYILHSIPMSMNYLPMHW